MRTEVSLESRVSVQAKWSGSQAWARRVVQAERNQKVTEASPARCMAEVCGPAMAPG